MQDSKLIFKIQELKQIKPRKSWVVLTKSRIFEETEPFRGRASEREGLSLFPLFFRLKPALATVLSLLVLIGIFGFAHNTVPGDFLYSVKKMTERSETFFASEEQKPKVNLELANKRLEELVKIAQANQVKKLAPAISEFQANISEAAKSLAKMGATTSDPAIIGKIVEETKKLEENKQKIESLGVIIGGEGTEEFNNALAKVVEDSIADLEDRTLLNGKKEILAAMKQLFEEEKYSEALELYLINQ